MTSNSSGREPVIIGVADVINRTKTPHEPLVLIGDAVQSALTDAAPSKGVREQLRAAANEVVIVRTWTWPYDDLAGLVAEKASLGSPSKRPLTRLTEHGGNSPVKALDEVCRKIAEGDDGIKVIAGGEALDSLTACVKNGQLPPPGWTPTSVDIQEAFSPTTRDLGSSIGGRHGIGAPIQVYPLYENAFRASRHQTPRENHVESAKLYADFAKVAEGHKYAWSHGRKAVTEQHLLTVNEKNRMICYPYPLLMNAFNNVNLAAAVIITSAATAARLGVPKEKWAYVLGAAGTSESDEFWFRPSFTHSEAISASIDAAISSSSLSARDIDIYDFYSCFPIVPKLAAHHLSLPPSTPQTLLGGLTSFGGAGNNYSMHALTEVTRRLRAAQKPTNALVLANGGVLTYQHAAVLSSAPRRSGTYPSKPLLPEHVGREHPEIAERAEGEAQVETFTVDFARSGKPRRAHVVGRLRDGRRFVANAGDESTVGELLREDGKEVIGRWGRVSSKEGRNLFVFEQKGRL